MALAGMKTTDMPPKVHEKIRKVLLEFGKKKQLEQFGRYVGKKIRSRSSTEIPTVLPSMFQHSDDGQPTDVFARLRAHPHFQELFAHMDRTDEAGQPAPFAD